MENVGCKGKHLFYCPMIVIVVSYTIRIRHNIEVFMPTTPFKSQNYIGGTYPTTNTENIPYTQHRNMASITVFVYIMYGKRL